jgi:hypothetical protein
MRRDQWHAILYLISDYFSIWHHFVPPDDAQRQKKKNTSCRDRETRRMRTRHLFFFWQVMRPVLQSAGGMSTALRKLF